MILQVKEDKRGFVKENEGQFQYVNSAIKPDGHWDVLVRTESGELRHFPSHFLEVVTKLEVVLK